MAEIKQRIDTLEERLTTSETRVSNTEDQGLRQERALAYLLSKDAKLTAWQDDLENRLRRNNIKVVGIPEDAEGKEMIPFITNFFKITLKLQEDMNICLERAHRAIRPKPKPTAQPRSKRNSKGIIILGGDFNRVIYKCIDKILSNKNIKYPNPKQCAIC